MNELLDYYKSLLGSIPTFLNKYLKCPTLIRLKQIGYFCGMDYASKYIYDFKEYITRYDHSLTVALLTYKLTSDKKSTIAALFHDIATPCFSHVIDYMNKDYATQESTEEYTLDILKKDKYLNECLKSDNLSLDDIDFKKYSIVDNKRPKVCADRLDGVILTGIAWTKNINKKLIKSIIDNIMVTTNSDNELEIAFKSTSIAKKVLSISESIDYYCHSVEDNYMMELLASITRLAISNNIITYDDLYTLTEDEVYKRLESTTNKEIKDKLYLFKNIKKEEVEVLDMPPIKIRDLNPLVKNKRLKEKYIVISDIHGSLYYMNKLKEIIDKSNITKIILLGDLYYHGPRNPLTRDYNPNGVCEILNSYKDKIICIKGNCDAEVDEMISNFKFKKNIRLKIKNKIFYFTHGHVYNIDNRPNNFDILVYGHFHIPFIKKDEDKYFVNPGSVSLPKNNSKNSFIIIDNKITIYDLDENILDSTDF